MAKLRKFGKVICGIILFTAIPFIAAAQGIVVQIPVEDTPMKNAQRNLTSMAQKPTNEQNWPIVITEFENIYNQTKNNEAANTIHILYKHRLKDNTNSLLWLRRAAEGGLVDAKLNLAIELKKDKANCAEVLYWLSQMPEWHGTGHWEKAKYYEDGFCAAPDPIKARALHELAAKYGELRAQYKLSQMQALGIGGPRDLVSAYAWMYIVKNTRFHYPELHPTEELAAIHSQLNGFPQRLLMRRVRQFCGLSQSACSLLEAAAVQESGFKRGY